MYTKEWCLTMVPNSLDSKLSLSYYSVPLLFAETIQSKTILFYVTIIVRVRVRVCFSIFLKPSNSTNSQKLGCSNVSTKLRRCNELLVHVLVHARTHAPTGGSSSRGGGLENFGRRLVFGGSRRNHSLLHYEYGTVRYGRRVPFVLFFHRAVRTVRQRNRRAGRGRSGRHPTMNAPCTMHRVLLVGGFAILARQ